MTRTDKTARDKIHKNGSCKPSELCVYSCAVIRHFKLLIHRDKCFNKLRHYILVLTIFAESLWLFCSSACIFKYDGLHRCQISVQWWVFFNNFYVVNYKISLLY
jgi:hypothetical protein